MPTFKHVLTVLVTLLALATPLGASAQSELTTEEIQARVVERAKEIEARKAEEKRWKELRKKDTSAMKQARREIEKEAEDLRDREKSIVEAFRRAAVSGCEEGTREGMHIEPRVTHGRPGFFTTSRVTVRVTNPYEFPVDIEDERGVVVRNLCPKGSMTLTRTRNYMTDGDYLNFFFTARGVFPGGTLGVGTSNSYRLSVYDSQNGEMNHISNWTIRLNVVQ